MKWGVVGGCRGGSLVGMLMPLWMGAEFKCSYAQWGSLFWPVFGHPPYPLHPCGLDAYLTCVVSDAHPLPAGPLCCAVAFFFLCCSEAARSHQRPDEGPAGAHPQLEQGGQDGGAQAEALM